MAAIRDATVMVDASDPSGSLHQAAECLKLNRWLFIARSVLEDLLFNDLQNSHTTLRRDRST